jgi:hypothetical protein
VDLVGWESLKSHSPTEPLNNRNRGQNNGHGDRSNPRGGSNEPYSISASKFNNRHPIGVMSMSQFQSSSLPGPPTTLSSASKRAWLDCGRQEQVYLDCPGGSLAELSYTTALSL